MAQRAARFEAQQRRDRVTVLREAANVWATFRDASLDDLRLPESALAPDELARYRRVRDRLSLLLETPGLVVLSGANGPGKTHLASALVHAFCEQCRAAYFCTAMDFYRALKSTFGQSRTAIDVIDRFRRYQLLVLDEIEVRSDSAWENNELRDLIGARDAMGRSTVLITNLHPDQINGTAGDAYLSRAIRDRMHAEGGGLLLCNWPSLRGRRIAECRVPSAK